MKFRGNVTAAVISLVIFLAFAVAGGVCLASGFTELVQNSDVINNFGDLVDYVDDFSFNIDLNGVNIDEDADRASAYYARTLSGDIDSIAIKSTGCAVEMRRGDEFSVSFTGLVPGGKYDDLSVESPDRLTVSSGDVSGSDVAFDAAYYENSGIIEAHLNGGELTVEIDATIYVTGFNMSVNSNVGQAVITIPADYTGAVEVRDVFAEMKVSGLSLSELILKNCMGETEIRGCAIDMFTVSNMAGEVDVDNSSIGGVCFENIAGEINVNSDCALTVDSVIDSVAGEINIELPYGSKLDIDKSGVLGEVEIDRNIIGGTGDAVLEITGVMGEVTVEIND